MLGIDGVRLRLMDTKDFFFLGMSNLEVKRVQANLKECMMHIELPVNSDKVHTHTHTHIHTYTHTHIHTYTHTHIHFTPIHTPIHTHIHFTYCRTVDMYTVA
jgi:hypothetical protein